MFESQVLYMDDIMGYFPYYLILITMFRSVYNAVLTS